MKRQTLAIAFSLVIVLGLIAFPVKAVTNSAYCPINDSAARTYYNCSLYTTYSPQLKQCADGYSYTRWYGDVPINADQITHKDILSFSGVGSYSYASGLTDISYSETMNSNAVTWTYTASNTWRIEVNYNYRAWGMTSITNSYMDTSATLRFGVNFYTFGT